MVLRVDRGFLFAFSGIAFYNISCCHARSVAKSRALDCARKALRIFQAALSPGHEDIAGAKELVRKLELAMR